MSLRKGKAFKNYKLHDVRVYSSPEWMAGGKKYRQVFDRMETTYIWVEFSFYNKLFDEEDWDAKLSVKAFSLIGGDKKELCNLEEKIEVKKDENIVRYHNGWGTSSI